jgi:DNA polymerase
MAFAQGPADTGAMDALAALSLQIAWGADEALDEAPLDRTRPPPPAAAPPSHVPPSHAPAWHGQASPGQASQAPDRPALARTAAPARPGPAARARHAADAATTIAALRDALAGFTDCPLAATATSLVFADGNPAAGLVLVSDVPGPEEDLSGRPLDGPAGALLDRMLASIGLDRTRLLITSLIPWRPPGNRPPAETEVAMCLPFLLRHLALLQPRIVVTLGALPARTLTGNDAGIRKLRGKWQELQLYGMSSKVKLLPMLHPAALMRTPAAKREAWADLLALQRALNSA